MSAADPFYENYETFKVIGSGAFGDVIFARLKESSNFFATKFIDPYTFKYGSSSQELKILKSISHNCVIGLKEVYVPHLPASSRQRKDGFPGRKETVYVFRRTTWICSVCCGSERHAWMIFQRSTALAFAEKISAG